MWEKIAAEVKELVGNRYNLVGDSWLLLESLGSVSCGLLPEPEITLYVLATENDLVYYVRAGLGYILSVDRWAYDARNWNAAKSVPLQKISSSILVELLSLSQL